ncbi:MAG TPA: alpha/beta hydrolase-fold protein [Pyrinomonadaceae bacterium]|nr:alpha/beta hydrolase-fold protein [Pyrinomonadaceae bacterium]
MLRRISRLLLTIAFFALCCLAGPRADAQTRLLNDEFRMFKNFPSKILSNERDVIIWLPPGYFDEGSTRRYPVLYMHDGGSVFVLWRIDEIAKPLIASGQIEPLIIVMIYNGGTSEARFDEYTPTRPRGFKNGGKADAYGRMLIEELKPFIDRELRTLPDAANTGLGGASLGGIATLHLGLTHPEVFGKLAVVSPSLWWDNKLLIRNVKALEAKPPLRIWLDIGTGEGAGTADTVRELRDALVNKGWTLSSDLTYFEAKGSGHDDREFSKRAGPILKFLFPARSAGQ